MIEPGRLLRVTSASGLAVFRDDSPHTSPNHTIPQGACVVVAGEPVPLGEEDVYWWVPLISPRGDLVFLYTAHLDDTWIRSFGLTEGD